MVDGFGVVAEGARGRSGNAPSEPSFIREEAVLAGKPEVELTFIWGVVPPDGRGERVHGLCPPNRLVGKLSGERFLSVPCSSPVSNLHI